MLLFLIGAALFLNCLLYTEEQVEEGMSLEEKDAMDAEEPVCEDLPCEEAESEDIAPTEQPLTEEQEAVEKMLSQSQVNEIVGRTRTETRDSTLKYLYDRYGANDSDGLDEMIGRSQKYDMLHDDYEKAIAEIDSLKTKLALYDSGIDPNRYEDATIILKGKGLDVTADNILAQLETHPEWKKAYSAPATEIDEVDRIFQKIKQNPASTISVLGNEKPAIPQSGPTERESAMNLFFGK